jgi:hypothetical protein
MMNLKQIEDMKVALLEVERERQNNRKKLAG